MNLSDYFEQHEEQAFVAKALATAVVIILVRNFLEDFIGILLLIFPVVFLIGIRMHAAVIGVDAMELLREHITLLPVMRSEAERRSEVKPWVTYGIILVNVLIFYGFEMNVPEEMLDDLVFLPVHPNVFNVPISAFASMFLHGSGGHLWGNMTFLWVVGTAVERRVGRLRFFGLYILTGLLAGLTYVLVEFVFNGRAGHALGASGAIAGIMGIFAVRCYFKSMIFPIPLLGIFSLIIPLSLKIRLNSLVIMSLFFLSDLSGGIQQIAGESESMVAHWAHLGGMITGMIIAGYYLKLGEEAVEERHLEIGLKASEAAFGYEGGERSMQIALDRNPENADAVLGMARLKSKFKPTPEGQELYEKALGLLVTARPEEVTEVFREYYSKHLAVPADHRLLWRLAELLRGKGETDLCMRCVERLVELEETPPPVREKALFQLATMLEQNGCSDAAQGCFARFVAEFPSSLLAERAREKAGGVVYRPARPAASAPQPTTTACPACGATMETKPAMSGPNQGKLFRVCSGYPACRTFLPVEEAAERAEFAPALRPTEPARYRLVFSGAISLSEEPETVRENLAQLFRCSREQVEQRLFSGGTTVIKKGLDEAAARRMKQAFEATGAFCTMEPETPVVAPIPPPPAQTARPPEPSAPAVAPFTCPKCGQPQERGESCVSCGVYFAKLVRQAERDLQVACAPPPARTGMSEERERQWAMWCHLLALSGIVIPFGNILGPLSIWLWKRKESEFIDIHGKIALNYQITLFLFLLGSMLVVLFTGFGAVTVGAIYGFLGLYSLGVVGFAAVRSHRGQYIDIPMSAVFLR